VCDWFNFPAEDTASLTVHKYICSTKTFVSDVDCEVHESGATFDLLVREGELWDYAGTVATDGYGTATFGPVEPGQYWLDEHDGDWCHIASEDLSGDGESIEVEAGGETVIMIYNCAGIPGKPGEIPTSFPNTGVPSARNDP
jgi:hypothetical protein